MGKRGRGRGRGRRNRAAGEGEETKFFFRGKEDGRIFPSFAPRIWVAEFGGNIFSFWKFIYPLSPTKKAMKEKGSSIDSFLVK